MNRMYRIRPLQWTNEVNGYSAQFFHGMYFIDIEDDKYYAYFSHFEENVDQIQLGNYIELSDAKSVCQNHMIQQLKEHLNEIK